MNVFKRILNLFRNEDNITDGYHTFSELYEHRCQLWILVCNCLCKKYEVFLIKEHYKGWNLLCMIYKGKQLSYHIPSIDLLFLDLHNIKEKKIEDYVWDKHTPKDVLELIKDLNLDIGCLVIKV